MACWVRAHIFVGATDEQQTIGQDGWAEQGLARMVKLGQMRQRAQCYWHRESDLIRVL